MNVTAPVNFLVDLIARLIGVLDSLTIVLGSYSISMWDLFVVSVIIFFVFSVFLHTSKQ